MNNDLELTTTGMLLLHRLAANDLLLRDAATDGFSVGTPPTGYSDVLWLPAQRLVDNELVDGHGRIEPDNPRSATVFRINARGRAWCAANPLPEQATLMRRLPVCDTPTVFDLDPAVCGTCGNLLDGHKTRPNDAQYQRVNQAMWKVMLALGAPYDMYAGGPADHRTADVRIHLDKCGIDWTRTEQPAMANQSVFENSFVPNSQIEILSGRVFCLCGKYSDLTFAIADMTVGQLIWHTVHHGDTAPAPAGPAT